jgi:hypothetical protein
MFLSLFALTPNSAIGESMTKNHFPAKLAFVFLAALFFFCACAKPSYINVTYIPPLESDVLQGRQVYLRVNDQRDIDTIFGDRAREKFKYFTGIFSLSVATNEKNKILLGPVDLNKLFLEAAKKRLALTGLQILEAEGMDAPVVEIFLKRFFLDRKGKNWEAHIQYDARLIKDGTVLATQRITGSAQRLKLLGTGDAEKLLGDIFTETVNKMDSYKLFSEAKL